MNSAAKQQSIDQNAAINQLLKRPKFDSSLILGIALIALFLVLFILEFSRILTVAGKVEHDPPAQIIETVLSERPPT